VTDPRPSWAVPLSWEATAKALGGRREALIRWGMFTDAISYRRICRLPQSLRTKELAVWGSCFVPGEPAMNRPVRELCAERNHGHEKYHKRLENIADNAGGQGTVTWVAPPPGLAEIQQKRTSLQILAQSRFSFMTGSASWGGLQPGYFLVLGGNSLNDFDTSSLTSLSRLRIALLGSRNVLLYVVSHTIFLDSSIM
jgi:hypothetical protein